MSSATKWFSLSALLLVVLVAMLWSGDDGPSVRDEASKTGQAGAGLSAQVTAAPPAPSLAREATAPGGDFSPPPGSTAQATSTAWPFAAPDRVKAAGAPAGWGQSLIEVVGAYWRAALSKLGVATAPTPTSPTAAPPATPAAPSAAASPAAAFETPPGVGSPRGGK